MDRIDEIQRLEKRSKEIASLARMIDNVKKYIEADQDELCCSVDKCVRALNRAASEVSYANEIIDRLAEEMNERIGEEDYDCTRIFELD